MAKGAYKERPMVLEAQTSKNPKLCTLSHKRYKNSAHFSCTIFTIAFEAALACLSYAWIKSSLWIFTNLNTNNCAPNIL